MIATLALLMLPDYRTALGAFNADITNLVGLLALSIVIGSGGELRRIMRDIKAKEEQD